MIRCHALLFAIAFATWACAQFPYTRVIDVRNGQQRPAIEHVVQDEQGLIWVGSDLGLLRTDGEEVEVMLRTEGNGVNALCVSKRGVIAALGTGVLVRCTALRCDTIWADTALSTLPVRALADLEHGV